MQFKENAVYQSCRRVRWSALGFKDSRRSYMRSCIFPRGPSTCSLGESEYFARSGPSVPRRESKQLICVAAVLYRSERLEHVGPPRNRVVCEEIVNGDFRYGGGIALWVAAELCTGSAVWTGVSHLLCTWRAHRAVNNIKSRNARDIECLEKGTGKFRQKNYPDLDGLDVYEYYDVVTMALNNSRVFHAWSFCLCFGIGGIIAWAGGVFALSFGSTSV